MNEEAIISAQVILFAANGASPDPKTVITSENIREWVPSDEAIAKVTAALRSLGFKVGSCVGNSLSIAGFAAQFSDVFQTEIKETENGGVEFEKGGLKLPSKKIPVPIKKEVAEITFTAPPDFGPGTSSFN